MTRKSLHVHFDDLRNIALNLHSEAEVLDRQAKAIQERAEKMRGDAKLIYNAWDRFCGVIEREKKERPCVGCGETYYNCDCDQYDPETK